MSYSETHNCKYCGNDFLANKKKRKFCSQLCANRNNRNADKAPVNHYKGEIVSLKCDHCDKEFSRLKCQVKRNKFSFCSEKCKNLGMTKGRLHNYKGGQSLSVTIRVSKKYSDWRKSVFDKNGECCYECGSEENLEIHHVVEQSDIIKKYDIKNIEDAKSCKELWDINNGQVLCVHCHADKHPDYRGLFKLRIAI